MIKKHIPNSLTCCNLICGCAATVFALKGSAETALLFIVGGAVFDFFDGFAARLLKVSSPIGKELDSLADVVTFGVAPSAMLFFALQNLPTDTGAGWQQGDAVPFVAFLMAAFSALRLAKFNLDERQATSFLGLPTPANALFWASLLILLQRENLFSGYTGWVLLFLMCVSCALLVSEIPMFALKFKSKSWAENKQRYLFILLSLAIIVWQGPLIAWSLIILFYVAFSMMDYIRKM